MWLDRHADTIDVDRFRAHNQYLEQGDRYDAKAVAEWILANGGREYLEVLTEDADFGAETCEVQGYTVSRDLVDSIMEIAFLERCLGKHAFDRYRILDIGAGYGRFAHRMTTRHPGTIVYCCDPIDVSQKVCAKYLVHRRTKMAICVEPSHLNQVARPDMAVNIHSWSECTLDEVAWWIDWLREREVPRLFIVPHDGSRFGTWGGEWETVGPSYKPLLDAAGYKIVNEWSGPPPQPKFYYLFEREAS